MGYPQPEKVTQAYLQLLSVQHFFLKLLDAFASEDEGLRDLPIAPSIAGGDEVGHSAALEEGGQRGAVIEDLSVLYHLHEAEPDDGSLGVVAAFEPVGKARAARHNVLERATDLDRFGVVNHDHSEIRSLEEAPAREYTR